MALRLGQDGYAFAKIDPVPKENPETKEIELTFLVDPGNRAYVRNILFTGSTGNVVLPDSFQGGLES